MPEPLGQSRPAFPIILGKPVFERHDRIAVDQTLEPIDEIVRCDRSRLIGKLVRPVAREVACGHIERQHNVAAWSVRCSTDRGHE
jgi:hypothetical protein